MLKSAVAAGAMGATALTFPRHASSDPIRDYDEAVAAAPAAHGIFGYGVASGDPTAHSLIIWTRATPPGTPIASPGSGHGAPLAVTWELARDPQFRSIVRTGVVMTHATSDHTVKVDVTGLDRYTRYWYRFRALGDTSPVGRTQTAPDDPHRTHALRFALVSCSNYTGGYFGVYRSISARDDLDFVLHVGDYIYEYGNGTGRYGPHALVGKRDAAPVTETIDLRGYRLRHALHKADPDLQAAHLAHPFITIFDDHEVANNAWIAGAKGHDPGTEGSFARRRADAYQAYLEWMPFRLPDQRHVPHRGTRFFRRFFFGSLADLSVLETRQNRSEQIEVAPYCSRGGGYIPRGIPAVNARLTDPNRHLPEPEQMRWLQRAVETGRSWHLLGNQVILTSLRFPGRSMDLDPDIMFLNSDQWDGYQADQAALTRHLAAQPHTSGDTVVLTGDIHSSWAMDIPVDRTARPYRSAGVEFVCPSVTSDGMYEMWRIKGYQDGVASVLARTRQAAGAIRVENPWVKYLDGVSHGYTVVDVTPDRVQGDWHLTPVPTPRYPDPRILATTMPHYRASWQTRAGSRHVTAAPGELGARADVPVS